MAIKGTMLRAVRKVRWVRGPNGVPKLGCSSCGWAKGLGHDQWCRYIARSFKCLALAVLAAAACACRTRYDAKITYERGQEKREAVFTSTEPAKIMLWMGDQSRENVTGIEITTGQELE